MSEFQVDWERILARLPLWRALARETREALLSANASELRPAATLRPDLVRLLAEHWVDLSVDLHRARPTHDLYPFIRLLRALARAPVLTAPEDCQLERYLRTHFTNEERMSLPGFEAYARRTAAPWAIAAALSSVSAPQAFLALKNAGEYERVRTEGPYHSSPARRRPLLSDLAVLRGAQALLRSLMDDEAPIGFEALRTRWEKQVGCNIGAALEPLLSYGLVLAELDSDLIPQVGLLPALRERLRRPAARVPSIRTPATTLSGILALEDLETLLLELITEPARMKQDENELFARETARLAGALRQPPFWIDRSPVLAGVNLAERLYRATILADLLGLAKVVRNDEEIPYLVATKAVNGFLRELRTVRVERVLECFRLDRVTPGEPEGLGATIRRVLSGSDEIRDEPLSLAGTAYSDTRVFDLFPTFGYEICRISRPSLDLGNGTIVCPVRDALVEAFASLEGQDFLDWEEWLERHSREGNPFLLNPDLIREPGSFVPLAGLHFSEERLEEHWARLLLLVTGQVLLPLGGIETGIDDEDRVGLRLTDLGAWILGRRRDLPVAPADPGAPSILVQPNFDVVFLAPSPGEEAAIAPFAERRGRGVGTLFSITRASCFAAASSGMSADEALGVLERVSKKGLPGNVALEMRSWFAQARVVEMRRAEIIVCPDEETTTKVLAIGGARVRLLSERVIEVVRGRSQLARALREKGVFVIGGHNPSAALVPDASLPGRSVESP